MHSKLQPPRTLFLSVLLVLFLSAFYWLEDAKPHKLIFYTMLVVFAFTAFRHKLQLTFWREALGKTLIAYFLYQILSLSWSPIFSGEEFGEVVRKSALTLGFVLVIATSLREMSQEWFFKAITILVGIAAISACLTMAWGDVPSMPMGRIIGYGRALNANQAGTLYGLILIPALWLLLEAKQERRLLPALCWMLLLGALLLTQSRGAWLAALAGQGLLLLLQPAISRKNLLYIFITALAAVLIAGIGIDWTSIIERMDGYRLFIWQHALGDGWSQSPLTGLGYRTPFSLTLPYGETIYQTHSIYVAALYQGGVLGLGVLLAVFVMASKRLWQSRAKAEARLMLALLANAALFGAVDYDILLVNSALQWPLFWLPIGGAIAVAMRSK